MVFTGHLRTEEAENDGVLVERVSTGDHAFRASTQGSTQHPAPCFDADKGKTIKNPELLQIPWVLEQ